MDTIDRKILDILQKNASISKAEIARRIALTPSAVFERIRKLEDRGAIQGYETRLDPEALGLGVLAFVFVTEERPASTPQTGRRLSKIVGVQEVHKIAGEDCYLVKVRAPDTAGLNRVLEAHFSAIKAVRRIRTTIVLQTLKESGALPLDGAGGGS